MIPSVWDQKMGEVDKDFGFGLSISELKARVGDAATKYTSHIASGLSWLFSSVAQPGYLSSSSSLYLVRTQAIPNVCAPLSVSPIANHISAPYGCGRIEKECRSSTWKMNIEASGKPTKPMLMEQAIENGGIVESHVNGVRDINWFFEANAVLSHPEYPKIQRGSEHFIYGMTRVDHPLVWPLGSAPQCSSWTSSGGRRLENASDARRLEDYSYLEDQRLTANSGATGPSDATWIWPCLCLIWRSLRM